MRDAKAFAAGVDEFALQLLGGRVGNGVHQDVDLRVLFLERREQGRDLLVVRHVALETAGIAELVDKVLGLGPHALVHVTDGQGCAGLVKFLGDAPGNRALVRQPEDHGCLARQVNHV